MRSSVGACRSPLAFPLPPMRPCDFLPAPLAQPSLAFLPRARPDPPHPPPRQVGIVIGITLANFLTAPSFHALGSARHWRFVFLVPSAFALFQLVVLPFCPQSPSFLIQKYGAGRTLSTLVLLHKPSSAIELLAELQAQVDTAGRGSAYTIPQLIGDVKLRKQLLVGVVIKVGVQFSGIDAIFYYSTLMFRHAHVADPQVRRKDKIGFFRGLNPTTAPDQPAAPWPSSLVLSPLPPPAAGRLIRLYTPPHPTPTLRPHLATGLLSVPLPPPLPVPAVLQWLVNLPSPPPFQRQPHPHPQPAD